MTVSKLSLFGWWTTDYEWLINKASIKSLKHLGFFIGEMCDL